MAEIRKFAVVRHLRSESTEHILRFRRGRLKQSGPGITFWFTPMSTAIANIPVDVRELPFFIQGKTHDYQDVSIQGQITYRISAPETLGALVDFSIDLVTGTYVRQPLEQVANLLIGNAQQLAAGYCAARDIRATLSAGPSAVRRELKAGLVDDPTVAEMGIVVLDVSVKDTSPSSELEKALQTPAREHLQQQADEAAFQRRAMAVEKERAIAENELNNQIELAKRENTLIDRRGANAQRQATEEAAATAIAVEGQARMTRVKAEAEADRIRLVESAQVGAERERLDIYREVTPALVIGLAAQELAGKLTSIEHLNVTPDLLAAGLNNLLNLDVKRMEG